MRLSLLSTLLSLFLIPSISAQSSTASPSPTVSENNNASSTPVSNSSLSVLTTTITSLIPVSSGPSQTSLLTLTLTLNTSSIGNTTLAPNGTLSGNGTVNNGTEREAWKEGDDWIPFHIRIDPAYGVLGALLIISGTPVAFLGGKNKWSSLAIVSGYALLLFTLVMILRFGVEENLQPPSPNPPSTLLRGLYLLACIIAAFIGAGIGIFFFNVSKYFVSAAGGFTFGWYLLELRAGGLITSVLGRWGLLGGLTVGSLLLSIVPKMEEPMVLICTAWIGATAFILGVDCYTRAGLKEFYIYNLGFHDLFPKLNGAKYPLTQTMIIELGILAAVVVIGAAIQAKVLNRIQKRLRVAREEEEMQAEAEEVAKAAERFKNVGSELQEWEEKHGNGKGVVHDLENSPSLGDGASSQLPVLSRDQGPSRARSVSPNIPPVHTGRGLYEEIPMTSPIARQPDTPSSVGFQGIEELKDVSTPRALAGPVTPAMSDPELEEKIRLLEEVRKARESVRGSIDELQRQTPTPSIGSRLDPAGSRAGTPGYGYERSNSRMSMGSRMLDDDGRNRRISTASSHILDAPSMHRRPSSSSRLLDVTQDTPRSATDLYDEAASSSRQRHHSSASSQMLDITHSRQISDASRLASSAQPSPTDWDRYMSDRQIISPPAPVNPNARYSQYDFMEGANRTSSMIDLSTPPMARLPSEERRIRSSSMLSPNEPTLSPQYHSLPSSKSRDVRPDSYGPGQIIGSASGRPSNNKRISTRSMTYEELSDKHRKRLSELQNPISSKMKEEEQLKSVKEQWERQKLVEKKEMEQKQRYLESNLSNRSKKIEERQEVLKSTDEWRRSVQVDLDGFGRPLHPRKSGEREPVRQTHGASSRNRESRYSSHIVN